MQSMPLNLFATPLLVAFLALVAAPALGYDGRTVNHDIKTEDVRSVKIKQRIGDLAIQGGGSDTLAIEIQVQCAGSNTTDCRRAAAKVRVEWRRRGSRLDVRVLGSSRFSSRHIRIDTTIKMPNTLPLETDTAIGDVTIADLKSDIEVDIGEGNAKLTLKRKVVRRVNLDVGVGDARILLGGTQIDDSGKVLDAVDWTNPEGKTIVEVDVGIGDAVVTLE